MKNQQIGQLAEEIACHYLHMQGLRLLTQNFHSRYGEIDLIMLDEQHNLCFIEVKARHLNSHSTAAESISHHKQQKTIQTAQVYLQRYPEYEQFCCRFDAFTIDYQHSNSLTFDIQKILNDPSIQLQWIQHAYTL